MTVTIERTSPDTGVIHASAAEWTLIRDLVRHAERVYFDIELLYSIPGPEALRRGKLQALIEQLDHVLGDPPLELPKADILLIWVCVRTLDGKDVPDVDEAAVHALVDRLFALDIHDLFDDDAATPKQVERWREASPTNPDQGAR